MILSEIPLIGYKKILYTTGLREQSRFAFHHAASLSRAYQAQLTVFHVVRVMMKWIRGYLLMSMKSFGSRSNPAASGKSSNY